MAKEFNVGISTIVDFLGDKGHKVEFNPNTKIEEDMYNLLAKEFAADKAVKEKSEKLGKEKSTRETITIEQKFPRRIPRKQKMTIFPTTLSKM